MNTLRIAGIAGTLTLALAATAGAATVRLVPLTGTTVAATLSSCSAAASVVAAPAVVPQIAAAQQVAGVTAVRVTIDRRGALTGASVLSSSGNPWLDRAALGTARLSRFTPELRDCERVGGEYAFLVDFTG